MAVVLERQRFSTSKITLPETPQFQSEMRVTSETFLQYLLDPSFEVLKEKFESHLILDFPPHFMDELYMNYVLVDVNSEETKQRVFDQLIDLLKVIDPEHDQIVVDQYMSVITEKREGERGRIVCYDLKKGEIVVSDITYGSYNEVTPSIYDVIVRGDLSLGKIHNHDEDSFFSLKDIHSLVIKYDGRRLTKAEILLCPSFQLLAMPTCDTPVITPDEFNQSIQNHIKEIEEDEHLKALRQKTDNIALSIHRTIVRQIDRLRNLKRELGIKVFDGEMTFEEYQRELMTQAEQNRSELGEINRAFESVNFEGRDYHIAKLQKAFFEFAREMEIVLYKSTNMKDFYRLDV